MQKNISYALFILLLVMYWACSNGGGKKQLDSNAAAYAGPPYTVQLEEFVNPSLPSLHAYIQAVYQDKIVMMGGRRNGLHNNYSFTGSYNDSIFVINTQNWATPEMWTVKKLSVDSKLLSGKENKEQFESNNAQFFTNDGTLYIVGGLLGKNTVASDTNIHTSPYITAVTLSALINTVNNGVPLASGSIRQVKDEHLAVTGGELELMDNVVKLVFGWNFGEDELYTHQVRSFTYTDDGKTLKISPITVCATCWDKEPDTSETGNFRRRDGSMSPMIDPANGDEILLYYAGVFKNGDVNFDNPVWIGSKSAREDTFTMRSNVYTCEVVPVYSPSRKQSYATLLGGMTNAVYTGTPEPRPVLLNETNTTIIAKPGVFSTIPFSNHITTLMIDEQHQYSQYLLPDSFPLTKVPYAFKDTTALPANSVTYNGTGSELMWTLPASKGRMPGGVVNYDDFIKANPQGGIIGYLHGGILSRVDNAFGFGKNAKQDKLTRASNRIFAVKIMPLKE